ncbi:hypothetical protein Ahy_B03g063241 isoform B [Arachis hypogaea]|uniref:Uncharacterized protein n=1 Tax=Arachis hypogaea TaxID=3818 RepID=A0A444ZWK9_ARAHY|nr:hypothetical protein Ahy_B03g063241 isoform B [Arachis hypogaea]
MWNWEKDFFREDSPESWKKPGAVSCFSLSFVFLDSISTTCDIIGLLLAAACVQKNATFMYLITSSSGNSPISGSTSSTNFPSSWSCHACYREHNIQ